MSDQPKSQVGARGVFDRLKGKPSGRAFAWLPIYGKRPTWGAHHTVNMVKPEFIFLELLPVALI